VRDAGGVMRLPLASFLVTIGPGPLNRLFTATATGLPENNAAFW
jgi:hypothetical protein